MTPLPPSLQNLHRFERIQTKRFNSSQEAVQAVAQEIAALIRTKAALKEHCVLGLATGSTPTALYNELVRMHQEEGLSFQNVITFNLDEYYPMPPDALQSYVRFMKEYLFDHVDIQANNIFIPDGQVSKERVNEYCREYEQKINSGDLISIAEVVRDLHRNDDQREQSYSERQLYEAALERLTREVAAVSGGDEVAAAKQVDEVLTSRAA